MRTLGTAAFDFPLGATVYQVRHRKGRITGATRRDIGRHVEPDELWALAERLGRRAALLDALDEQTDAVHLSRIYGDHEGRRVLGEMAGKGSRSARIAIDMLMEKETTRP